MFRFNHREARASEANVDILPIAAAQQLDILSAHDGGSAASSLTERPKVKLAPILLPSMLVVTRQMLVLVSCGAQATAGLGR